MLSRNATLGCNIHLPDTLGPMAYLSSSSLRTCGAGPRLTYHRTNTAFQRSNARVPTPAKKVVRLRQRKPRMREKTQTKEQRSTSPHGAQGRLTPWVGGRPTYGRTRLAQAKAKCAHVPKTLRCRHGTRVHGMPRVHHHHHPHPPVPSRPRLRARE